MHKFAYLAGGSALAMTLALGSASAAWAQSTPTEVEEVIVTGSLIAGTPEDAALPVDVISQEDLQKQGSPSTVELIKALSVSSGVLGDTNQFDPRAQGSEGSGSVNLRGLVGLSESLGSRLALVVQSPRLPQGLVNGPEARLRIIINLAQQLLHDYRGALFTVQPCAFGSGVEKRLLLCLGAPAQALHRPVLLRPVQGGPSKIL